MNDSKDFQDAESVRSGNSHVTSQPGVFPVVGLLRPSFVSPRRTDGPPNIWDTSRLMISSQNLRVFWKPVKPQDCVRKTPNYHEDHIAGRLDNSLQHYNLVHKFIPMPQAMEIPAAKATVDKEWENLKRFRRGT